jgi:CRISPR-associated endoribonuclease Cas6
MLNIAGSPLHDCLASSELLNRDKLFRNYVFSHLIVPDRKIESDRLLIQCERVSLIFSTVPDPELVPLVTSNFLDTRFMLGDKLSQVPFNVEKVEKIPEPEFSDKMTFRTISPIHLSVKIPGRKNDLHLSPEDDSYARYFYENLHQKYSLLYGHEHPHEPVSGKFKLRSEVTQKGITINAGTSGQSKLIGYQLRFRLQADPELIRSGYYLGFGEKNHLGFGCCENL